VDTWVDTAYSGFNIRTFVIGAPGSEGARGTLSKIAFDGRTASANDCERENPAPQVGDCHLDMTASADFAADLSDALRGISESQALACDFELPINPSGGGVNLSSVNVTFRPGTGDPVDVLLDDQGDCAVDADGWQFSADFRRIVLCGSACDQVRADLSSRVEIVLGCPTVKVVVSAPACSAPWTAPAAPPSDCISVTSGTAPQRFVLPAADHSSDNSPIVDEGVIG
jgi:hypothetical protein